MEKLNMLKKIILGFFTILFSYFSLTQVASATDENKHKLVGEVGLAVFHNASMTTSDEGGASLLPYAYATYGDFFARIDTIGMKVIPVGYGNFEIATRISLEGYKQRNTTSVSKISNPAPVGISTSQITPYGVFFGHLFYDPNSKGTLFDIAYAAKFNVGAVSIYPQIGIERRSEKYVQYLYGVNSMNSKSSYTPGASTGPNIGITADYPLDNKNSVKFNLRKKWFDRNISDSPFISSKSQTNGFIAITHNFK
jgi:outer membrane protein